VIIPLIVMGISLAQFWATKRFMNPEKRRQLDAEVKAFRAEMAYAKSGGAEQAKRLRADLAKAERAREREAKRLREELASAQRSGDGAAAERLRAELAKAEREGEAEARRLKGEMARAERARDPQALKRLEKRAKYIQQIEGEVAKATAKQFALTMAIILPVFYLVIPLFTAPPAFLPVPPFSFPFWSSSISIVLAGGGLHPFMWYFIAAGFFQTLLGRIMGVSR